MEYEVLRHQPGDTVGIVLSGIEAGTRVRVKDIRTQELFALTARAGIPVFHKIALEDMEKAGAVTEYGQTIGEATGKISRGDYVHIHNIKTRKWW